MVAPRVSDSSTRKARRSDRTRTSRSTVTWRSALHSAPGKNGLAYLVKQQNVPFSHEPHAELYSPPLSVRDLMHVPLTSAIPAHKDTQRASTNQSRSTSRMDKSRSRRTLCRYPPTESRNSETTISPRTTGLLDHSVPRYMTPYTYQLQSVTRSLSDVAYSWRVHEHILPEDPAAPGLGESLSGKDAEHGRFASWSYQQRSTMQQSETHLRWHRLGDTWLLEAAARSHRSRPTPLPPGRHTPNPGN